jgi:uncharacterized membrane protein YdfJ with MMPL/SSD domain
MSADRCLLLRPLLRHPRWVLGIAAALAVTAFVLGQGTVEVLSNRESDFYSHESESYRTNRELEVLRPRGIPGPPDISVVTKGNPSTVGEQTKNRLERLPQMAKVEEYVFPSRDGRASSVIGWLGNGVDEGKAATEVSKAMSRPGVVVGGPALAGQEFSEQIETGLRRAELIGLPLLILLGLWVFRGVVAALLPAVVGGFTLLCALACMRGVAELSPLSTFSLNIAVALALGLGVDYCLLMVSRFREELAVGRTAQEATRGTLRTAGRSVLLSAAAIAGSFSALLVFPVPFIRSVAVGAILVAVIAGAISVSVVPALLRLLGSRVNALAPSAWSRRAERDARPRGHRGWHRLAEFVMRRRFAVALASGLVLLAMSTPWLSLRLTGFSTNALPPSAEARVFSEQIRRQFAHPILGEIVVAIHTRESELAKVGERVERLSLRTRLAEPFPVVFKHASDLFQFRLNPVHQPFSDGTERLVRLLRHMDAPITVAGETAEYMDLKETLAAKLPLALAILAGASCFFVFFATGSIVLPLKALFMNALSLGAALGLLVLVFQDGRFGGLLGYDSQGALPVTLPFVIGAGAFGLFTDYNLFLLMRVKEAAQAGLSDRDAIAFGLERSGPIISAAALLFCVAVGALATSGLLFVKEAAVGIVLAVVLDAFVTRPLLVPSLMAILGRWNWWPRGVRAKEGRRRDHLPAG